MDSQYLSPTTELDAINTMLGTIGETPVSTLSGDVTADVLMAMQILGRVMREVQSEGWHFNTEEEYPLTPNQDGEIVLATNMISVDLDPSLYGETYDLVIRGSKVYDRKNHTFIFDTSLTLYASVTWLLAFTDLPESARNYITIKASREFLDATVGSDTLHGFSEKQEIRALIRFRRDDGKQADRNLLSNMPYVRRRANYAPSKW